MATVPDLQVFKAFRASEGAGGKGSITHSVLSVLKKDSITALSWQFAHPAHAELHRLLLTGLYASSLFPSNGEKCLQLLKINGDNKQLDEFRLGG